MFDGVLLTSETYNTISTCNKMATSLFVIDMLSALRLLFHGLWSSDSQLPLDLNTAVGNAKDTETPWSQFTLQPSVL